MSPPFVCTPPIGFCLTCLAIDIGSLHASPGCVNTPASHPCLSTKLPNRNTCIQQHCTPSSVQCCMQNPGHSMGHRAFHNTIGPSSPLLFYSYRDRQPGVPTFPTTCYSKRSSHVGYVPCQQTPAQVVGSRPALLVQATCASATWTLATCTGTMPMHLLQPTSKQPIPGIKTTNVKQILTQLRHCMVNHFALCTRL